MFLVKNSCCLLSCKAFGASRVETRWCFMYLDLISLQVLGWDESYNAKKLHVKNLCCLPNCKAFGRSRVKARWWFMYLHYSLAFKALGETRATTRKCFWWRTCVVHLIVRPSVGRGSRLDDVSCFWSNYRFLITCKVLGGARATTRKCFWWKTCVVYLIVRDVSCILVGQLAFFTHL